MPKEKPRSKEEELLPHPWQAACRSDMALSQSPGRVAKGRA